MLTGGPFSVASLVSLTAVVLVVVGFGWHVVSVQQSVPAAKLFHDTQFYFAVARSDLWSLQLWAGARSPLPALLFKACNLEPERIRFWLSLISIVSWSAFALVLSRSIRAWYLKPVAAALALSLGASRAVAQWNHLILSESLSLSLAAVCLASSLLFLARPKIWLGPTLLSVLAFGLCRDSNAYLILMLAGLAAMLAAIRAARRRSWWPSAGLALGLLFAFSIVNASADLGMRWEYPLTNVIVSRVLPDPVRRAAFHAQGMPNPPSLAPRRARRFYGSDPSIEPVRNWIAAHGKPTYARFLLSSPRYLLTEPKLVELLGGHVEGYGPPGMRDNLPQFVERLWSEGAWSIQLVVVVGLAVACILVPTARVNPLGVVGLCLAVSVFPHALVIWHGDTMETARHELQAVVQLRVSLILLLLALTDTLLAGRLRSWKERAQSSRAAAA